jgi:hypothetical protein
MLDTRMLLLLIALLVAASAWSRASFSSRPSVGAR